MVRQILGDDGGGSAAGSAGTIKAAPTAKLSFSKPAVQTYSGATQTWGAPAGTISPYSNMPAQGSNDQWNAPTNSWTPQAAPAPAQQSFAPPPPPPPPAPPVGGRQWYSGLNENARAAQDKSWLGGDSDYTAQIAEYDRALETFIDRIMNQKKMFNQDADDAVASTGRNQSMSLDALGEDFGARGLSYSGMFDTTKNQTNERFNEAKGGIEKVRSRNLSDATNREADYRSENQISRGNAERSSLARQAQRQALLDSMAGF